MMMKQNIIRKQCFEQEQTQFIKLKYGKKSVTVYLDWSLKDKLIIDVYDPNDEEITPFWAMRDFGVGPSLKF